MKFLNIIKMELVYFLTGKQNFQREINRKMAGKAFNFKLSGKTSFLGGLPSTLAGQCFSGVVTGGCLRVLLRKQIDAFVSTFLEMTFDR